MRIKRHYFDRWLVFLMLAGLAFINAPAVAGAVSTGDYFPLGSGMAWTYLEDGLNSATLTVLPGTEVVNGVATKAVLQTGGEYSGSVTNYSSDANGIREHKEFSPDVFIDGVGFQDITVILDPPMKYTNAAMAVGDVINSSGVVYYAFSGLGMFPLSYVSTSKLAKFENVSVPFGNFTAIKIQNSLTISGLVYGQYFSTTVARTFWLAEFVGLVKSLDITDGVQSVTELIGVNFQPYLTAGFAATPISGVLPQTVHFTDQSVGNITSWSWNFGDGGISSAQHPAHVYAGPGAYSVSLTVSGQGRPDTEIKTGYIRIALPGGDINKDHHVGLADLLLALQISANVAPSSAPPEIADVNGDMKTGLAEAVYILQFISELN